MFGLPRSLSGATPRVLTPATNDVILCHAAALTVKVSPDDAVLCISVKDAGGTVLGGPVQRSASSGVYAGNIDFGPLPEGAAYLHVCYAKDGVSCASGTSGCSVLPILVECKVVHRESPAGAKKP